MKSRLLRLLPLMLALSPALLPLWQILHFGVNIPSWDQFDDDLAGLHIKAHDTLPTFGDLAAQHNEHRILIPRLCYLVLGRLTGGNAIAEMLFAWGLAVATALVLLRLIPLPRTGDASLAFPTSRHGSWFLLNLLLFSPAQAENWLWGISLANLMPMFWTASAILVAASRLREKIRLPLVVLLCAAAAVSSGNGMLAWGLVGIVLLWEPTLRGLRSRWRSALVLTIAAGVVIGAYFWHLAPPNHRGAHPYGASVFSQVHYALAFAGSPFAQAINAAPATVATGFGLILNLLLLTCAGRFVQLWRAGDLHGRCRRALPWIAVAGFAVGSGLIAAHARAGLGIEQATASRYVSFALYLPAALVVLVPLLEPWRLLLGSRFGIGPAVATTGGTTLILLSLAVIPPALRLSETTHHQRRLTRAVAAFSTILPDHPLIASWVFPDNATGVRNVRGLDAIGYLHPRLVRNNDATKLAAPRPPRAETVGRLERAWEIGPGEIAFAGWASLPAESGAADLVVLCVADDLGTPRIVDIAPVGAARPDKENELGPAARTCGWALRAPAHRFLPSSGRATVTAWAYDGARGELFPLAGTVTLGP